MAAYPSNGKTTLTLDVLVTIARMAALEVEGVKAMAPIREGISGLFGHDLAGVRLSVEDNNVTVDLYLILNGDVNIREVGRQVQQAVARAIIEMTGLEVGSVNIHVEDVEYPAEE